MVTAPKLAQIRFQVGFPWAIEVIHHHAGAGLLVLRLLDITTNKMIRKVLKTAWMTCLSKTLGCHLPGSAFALVQYAFLGEMAKLT